MKTKRQKNGKTVISEGKNGAWEYTAVQQEFWKVNMVKENIIYPAYKKGKKGEFKNYWDISLWPYTIKI